jgi:hypothetical protein
MNHEQEVARAVHILERLVKHAGPCTARDQAFVFLKDHPVEGSYEAVRRAGQNGKRFLIGQRVIVGDEIGTVQRGRTVGARFVAEDDEREGYVWVYLPSKGYASHYAEHNVQELPGGQL